MRRIRLVVLLTTLVLSLLALAFRTEIQIWIAGVEEGVQRRVGRPAPELPRSLRSLEGPELRLAGLRGRVILLHFWTYG
jgi:hypothetical protein